MGETLVPHMRWWGWGTDGHDAPLPPAADALLGEELGTAPGRLVPAPLERVALEESRLAPPAHAELAGIVGDDHVRTDRLSRVTHAGGRSYPDLVRLRAGQAEFAPDAVVEPADGDEVAGLLAACARLGVAVVPFGGGTSVVGGVEALRGPFDSVVSVDLRRLTGVLSADPHSLLATIAAGTLGPAAEAELGARGLTLGHFPQSFEFSTVGGWVATRSAGQSSTGYGRIDELVVAMKVATPSGWVESIAVPASAAGPDLRELLIGSEGTMGIITEATFRVRPAPRERRYEAWSFRTWEAGADALRELEQSGHAPDVARLSDEDETRLSMTLSSGVGAKALARYLGARGHADGCLAITGFEGDPEEIAYRRYRARSILRGHGALGLGTAPAEKWVQGRFHGPYLRDELLARGIMVDTLETATTWTGAMGLYEAVRSAILGAIGERGHRGRVMCHISHLYPTGCSLYFTFLTRQEQGTEMEQWHAVKSAAGDAIASAGGTISHHHAVGRDHAPWLGREVGELGLDLIRAAKATLDPEGVMNPGKLVDGAPLPGA
ncbi:MAG: alkyldihydroxyacetonephosphate synthase [Thermoleophilaceae bacterium]|jgi:alkyldihydroxyacetonephosphate synthase|nr:alkyldihydroxyacetonephosphate synthase [Thermoleophilaceae bacterium]